MFSITGINEQRHAARAMRETVPCALVPSLANKPASVGLDQPGRNSAS
jgi:hypothetical protein